MKTVSPDGQTSPLSRSNEPQSKEIPHFFLFLCAITFAMDLVGSNGQIGPFSKSNEPRSRQTPHFTDFHML
ncbi:hypothetical protein H5410_062347 [Solanum commersonii]|uniref:Uncharacterized protein n=1 Tax=Solanum commersonii TaxID=4109 RepID=A0A9J5WAL5_SOLCO|nr:hypothetical protein H5410_062347 [Solanum commersonii]